MLEDMLMCAAGHIAESECAPGVKCYELDVHPVSAEMKLSAAPGRLELLFCSAGELTLRPPGPNKTTRQGLVVSSRQVLLLGGGDWDLSLRSKRLQGVLVCSGLEDGLGLCSLFAGGCAEPGSIRTLLEGRGGAMTSGQSAWSEAAFSAMRELGEGERGRYCAVKGAELLYLLSRRCSHEKDKRVRYRDPYLIDTVKRIHRHMLDNLGERLTIGSLSSEFHISATSFKECFRELYGQSVHAYLLGRRMELAGELLRTTDMPVFKVAERAGYGSASQFGVEFKRRYSMSPQTYRKAMREKMSDSNTASSE